VKFAKKKKFKIKVLLWIAVGPNGMSKPLIRLSDQEINSDIYLEECVKKHLLLYIRANCINHVLSLDLASAHYEKKVTNFLSEGGIIFEVRTTIQQVSQKRNQLRIFGHI